MITEDTTRTYVHALSYFAADGGFGRCARVVTGKLSRCRRAHPIGQLPVSDQRPVFNELYLLAWPKLDLKCIHRFIDPAVSSSAQQLDTPRRLSQGGQTQI